MKPSRNETDPSDTYVLGHSDQELERLSLQARLIDPITRGYLLEAGLAPGMRVLDVGCGAGDVSFLAAQIVGDRGEVVGADTAPAAITTARARAQTQAQPRSNLHFLEGDPAEMSFEQPFDAVVGRYVLQFQRDPAAMLEKLARHVRPGGVIVFQEIDWDAHRSFPPVATYEQSCRWILETLRARGADPRMGIKLHAVFVAAGLPAPTMRSQSLIGGGPNAADIVRLKVALAATLLPEMERLGVATAAEVGIDSLSERMLKEVVANGSVIVENAAVGAWSRV